nr:DUF456 domain-containing protein [Ardenticatena sp.]
MQNIAWLWLLLSGVAVVLSLAGLVLPFIPSALFLFLAACFYDAAFAFEVFGRFWLALLAILAALGSLADWWVSYMLARRGGASRLATLAGMVGSLVGLLVFSLPGFVLGAIVGIVLVEGLRQRHPKMALRAGFFWFVGWVAGLVVQVLTLGSMLVIYVWRVSMTW